MTVNDLVTKTEHEERFNRLEQQIESLTNAVLHYSVGPGGRATDPAVAADRPGQPFAVPAALPPAPYTSIEKRLLAADVPAPLTRRLIGELQDGLPESAACEEMRSLIARRLVVGETLRPLTGKTRIVALIGATGVGKTTTLTKIAAQFSLVDGYKIGIVSMDTHRIAAAKQLETYGEILRVPVRVAYGTEELAHYCSEFAADQCDFVLIDTAGKSPNDALPLAEIAGSLSEVASITRLLAIPATLSSANHDHMVSRFRSLLNPDAVILTKLDEAVDCTQYGRILGTQARFGLPLMYLTTGQRVPDDLAVPDAHVIANKILPTGS